MNDLQQASEQQSPFHSGEKFIQNKLGVAKKMERFGRQVIRNFMPDQHQAFYSQLPFVFVGHADQQGWPWASILFNKPGFIHATSQTELEINCQVIKGDPLAKSLTTGSRLGLLGIDLETRRRNRLATHINQISENSINLTVDQAFGNCPQYIQKRQIVAIDNNAVVPEKIEELNHLDLQAIELIKHSDTFFVASYLPRKYNNPSEGADVSHRGGKPGFIRIDNQNMLTIPDYLGNFHFNTLGNFLENPKAGLLFIDFELGHILTLTGTVKIIWDSPDTEFFTGAERLWQFQIDHGYWLKNTLPWRWKLEEYSSNSILAGNWEDAISAKKSDALKNSWQPYTVSKIIKESSVITSFYLQPPTGQQPQFKAGQFLSFKANINGKEEIRTYTVSSAPGEQHYRISVKKEGVFSSFLHHQIAIGDIIQTKAPTGEFTFNSHENKPAILISAGIGITPMISMAHHAVLESIRTRSMRAITLICCARNSEQRAFFDELKELTEYSGHQVKVIWVLSQPEAELKIGIDYHFQGRLTPEMLNNILGDTDSDIFLCGPTSFMQAQYDAIRDIGIADEQIFAEAFGPASLVREKTLAKITQPPVAEHAIVTFAKSKLEQAWSHSDGSLLELAEAHGLQPAYGCRNGQCGSCKVNLLSGKVSYQQAVQYHLKDNEILICCSVPADDGQDPSSVIVDL